MINLVLDVNVILDMWLSRNDTTAIDALFDKVATDDIRFWVSACSLPIIDYVFIASLKKEGVPSQEAKKLARELLAELMTDVSVLCAYDPEHAALLVSSNDMEDAQIALAAATLSGEVYIITQDKRFDTQNKVIAMTPLQMLSHIEST